MFYQVRPEDLQENSRRFKHHGQTGDQCQRHADIRRSIRSAADFLLAACPPGRERALALTKLEEAMFWANAAVAREPAQSLPEST